MIGPATLNQSLVLKHMWCHRHKWGFWNKNKTTRKLKQGTKPKNQVPALRLSNALPSASARCRCHDRKHEKVSRVKLEH